MCYCSLGPGSGALLAALVSKTAVSHSQIKHTEEEDSIFRQKQSKEQRKKKTKATVTPAEIEPWLEKLHLSDNAIDTFGPGNAPGVLSFAHRIYSLIKFSTHLTELDLSDNHIGDQAGKVLLEALQERREADLDSSRGPLSMQCEVLIRLVHFVEAFSIDMAEMDDGDESGLVHTHSGSSGSKSSGDKMFSLKKWNAVAMWSWDVECDTCAICRVQVM
ncbi:hypothetical protein JZ751_001943, partial [Albula glossodonta]